MASGQVRVFRRQQRGWGLRGSNAPAVPREGGRRSLLLVVGIPLAVALSRRALLTLARQRRVALAGAMAVGAALAIVGGVRNYAGILGTWPVSVRRVYCEAALLGVRPPLALTPAGTDPYRWLLEADPHLADTIRLRLENEAALRLLARSLGVEPTPKDIAHMEARLRATPAWRELAGRQEWPEMAWQALAERCAWQQAALNAMSYHVPGAALGALYRRQYQGAPAALSFALVKPALAAQLDSQRRLKALEARVAVVRAKLRTVIWDRCLK